MNCPSKLSKPCAWIEGITTVEELISDLADNIVNAEIPLVGGGVEESKWKVLYHEREHAYVEYEMYNSSVSGRYIHTDGKNYVVHKLPSLVNSSFKDPDGYIWEIKSDAPTNKTNYEGYVDYRTGKKVNVEGFTYENEYYEILDGLVVLIDENPDKLEKDFENTWEKYQAYLVKHTRESYYEGEVEDKEWNYFKIVAPLPDDWTYVIWKSNGLLYRRYTETVNGEVYTRSSYVSVSSYNVNHTRFRTEIHKVSEKMVLECDIDGKGYNLLIERPLENNNYLKINYGFEIKYQKNLEGNPEKSYDKACDLDSIGLGKTPIIIDELEAYQAFERQLKGEYGRGELELSEHISPNSYWFFSRNSTESWMPVKMRGSDSIVQYFISFNNDRAIMVLNGDPSFDYDSHYSSLAYIGKFNPLDPEDTETNFAVTVGMGDSGVNMTGFTYGDINKKTNPDYARYGRNTSNGMDTVSVLKGKSGLSFQEYLPAFLVHLPNYPDVGTLPKGVERLRLNDYLFQPSAHTEHIHSSPIYLVNGYEGYRGYLDGIVAIYDHYMLDGEELEYEVEGNTEVYKFFRITSPINFLGKSPSPGNTASVAILREIL